MIRNLMILEGGNYAGIFLFFIGIMLIPPIILTIIGFSVKKNHPKAAKVLFILAGLYLVIGLGICGSLMS